MQKSLKAHLTDCLIEANQWEYYNNGSDPFILMDTVHQILLIYVD